MKVLYIDPQSKGNLAQYDYNLLRNIDAKIIYCCSIRYDSPIIEHVDYRRIFKYTPSMNPVLKLFSYAGALCRLWYILNKEHPDIVHIQWWRVWFLDYLFLYIIKLYCKNVVYTAHNVLPHDSGNSYLKKCKLYYSQVSQIIVHVQRTKEELHKQMGISLDKITVIPHGIQNYQVNENKIKSFIDAFSNKYDLRDKLIVSAMGTQAEYKGTELIKQVFLDHEYNWEHLFLIVAGKGNIITTIDVPSKWRSNIYVNNTKVSAEEFQALMRLSDVVLLPYKCISQSGVLMTALSNQIPYLATNVGGLQEPINIAPIGFKMDVFSAHCLAEEIHKLIERRSEVKDLKRDQALWRKIKSAYDWKPIGQRTKQCYEQLLMSAI